MQLLEQAPSVIILVMIILSYTFATLRRQPLSSKAGRMLAGRVVEAYQQASLPANVKVKKYWIKAKLK